MAKRTDLPDTAAGLAKEAQKVRQELSDARLAHALQKLDSPAKLRSLRRRLAHILTLQNQAAKPSKKELIKEGS